MAAKTTLIEGVDGEESSRVLKIEQWYSWILGRECYYNLLLMDVVSI